MHAIRAILLGVGIALGAGAAWAQSADTDAEAGEELYTIQPGDVISIQVLEDSSLNRDLLVQPDGRISFPLAGIVKASGRTPGELQEILSRRLSSDFLQPPSVTVSLASSPAFGQQAAAQQRTFFVLGQVGQPGQFALSRPLTVVQALALAGGPGVFAATGRIQVRSVDEDGQEQVSLFDYEALEDGESLGAPLMVKDGDVIFVPESGFFE